MLIGCFHTVLYQPASSKFVVEHCHSILTGMVLSQLCMNAVGLDVMTHSFAVLAGCWFWTHKAIFDDEHGLSACRHLLVPSGA